MKTLQFTDLLITLKVKRSTYPTTDMTVEILFEKLLGLAVRTEVGAEFFNIVLGVQIKFMRHFALQKKVIKVENGGHF